MTPTVLPSKSFGPWIGEDFATQRLSVCERGVLIDAGAITTNGSPFATACPIAVVAAIPKSESPVATEVRMFAADSGMFRSTCSPARSNRPVSRA